MSSSTHGRMKQSVNRRRVPLRIPVYLCLLCVIAACLWLRLHSASRVPGASSFRDARGGFDCKETVIKCGKVRLGQPVQRTIRLFNDSSETRHILKVSPSRSFVKAVDFSKAVAPQSWGEVAVSIDPARKPGVYQACVLIITDYPQRPFINAALSCEVLPAGGAKPQRVK